MSGSAPSHDQGSTSAPPSAVRQWTVLAILLALSVVLRILLARGGGQHFWLDEWHRFGPCLWAVESLQTGEFGKALDTILVRPIHTGFFAVGIPVAALTHTLLSGNLTSDTLWVPAALLALASVACIALTYLLALRAGGDRTEGLIAAFLMASSNAMFYYSRHLLPYDSAMALALVALWIGLHPRTSARRSLLVGLIGGLAFFTYNGYLTLVLTVAAIHVLRARSLRAMFTRALATGVGLVVWPPAAHALSLVRGVEPYFPSFYRLLFFATQGDFSEGWRVVWEYLWHVEHGLLVVWLLGAGLTLVLALGRPRVRAGRGLLWLGAATMLYVLLTLNSTFLEKAVVLGRFTRQLVPFLCLATAFAAREALERGWLRGLVGPLAAAGIAVQAAANFATPLTQRFPIELDREIVAAYGQAGFTRDLTIDGPEWHDMHEPKHPSPYVILNTATFLYPVRGVKPAPVAGRTVLRFQHPLAFLPYQYEVFGPKERAILRSADISIRLVDTRQVDDP